MVGSIVIIQEIRDGRPQRPDVYFTEGEAQDSWRDRMPESWTATERQAADEAIHMTDGGTEVYRWSIE